MVGNILTHGIKLAALENSVGFNDCEARRTRTLSPSPTKITQAARPPEKHNPGGNATGNEQHHPNSKFQDLD